MKTFLKYLLASFIGTFIALFIVFFVLLGSMLSSISFKGKSDVQPKVKENSVLRITFDENITDKPIIDPFDISIFNLNNFEKNNISLKSFIDHIKKAKTDKKIKGIFLDFKGFNLSLSKAEEIRNALLDFKKSGKFIIARADLLTQYQYYIASVADRIYLSPEGAILFQGMNAQIMFYKKLLEKLEIKAEIIRHGKFKSAIEPFVLDSMSEENYLQTKVYVSSLWNHLLEAISASRNIPVDTLNYYADNLIIISDSSALVHNLVDGLKYKDEIEKELKNMIEIKEDDDINYISMTKYSKTTLPFELTNNKIAIVYAVGEIHAGNGKDLDKIYPDRLIKYINEATNDTSVKAIVLRVNSPGGSALSSEVIWRELILAKQKKPLIISFGDLAASGGYYIATAGDYIVTNHTTITGSIGVFGILWNAKDFLNNKVGINVSGYKTNKYADFGQPFRPLTSYERQKLQSLVEKTYRTFMRRVADGRNMTIAEVDSIGQGRVWSGINALQIGLADEFGGLNDAIKIAAKKANIKKYKIVEFPKKKDFMELLIEEFVKEFEQAYIKTILPEELLKQKEFLEFIKKHKGVMALMPYNIIFN